MFGRISRRGLDHVAPAAILTLLCLMILPQAVLAQPVLSSIQRDKATIASGSTSVTVPISPVDLSKCFLNFSYRTADTTGQTNFNEVRGKFNSTNQLLFDRRGAGTAAIHIVWDVVCFSSRVNVQSGDVSFASGETAKDVPITPVTRAFAIVSANAASTGRATNAQAFFRAELISSLKLTRAQTASATTASWFVVELSDGASVQAGTRTGIDGSSDIVGISAVDPSKSLLIFSVSGTSGTNGEPDNLQIRGQIATSTLLTFERGGAAGRFSVAWYVVSLTSGISVQRGNEPFASTDSLRNVALSPAVDPDRCFVLRSTWVKLNAGDAEDAVGLFSAELTSAMNLRLQRDRTGRDANVAWQVVCFDAAPLTVDITNPTALSPKFAKQGDSFNVGFTTNQAGSYTIKVDDTICGTGSAAVGANTKPCALPPAFAEGIKNLTVEVTDASGNTASDSESEAVRVDNTSPADPTNVRSTSHTPNIPSKDNTIDMAWDSDASDPVSSGVSSGVDGYSVAFTVSSTPFCDKTKDLEETAGSFTSSPLPDSTYFFHLCTVDNAGNWTATVTVGPFIIDTKIYARDVVINEIAWMGTPADANDEWIELFNNTNQAINLSGWTLVAQDGTPNIALSGTIPANGFFLLERTADTTVSDILADKIYTGALSNDGEILFLKDPSGNVIDSANGDGGPWPAGANPSSNPAGRATMERINPLTPDSDANWATNDGFNRNGRDASNNPINGTPKAKNSTLQTPKGDVNRDGNINIIDARICLQGALGFVMLTPERRQICDVDNDGDVDRSDAERIARFSIGLESRLVAAVNRLLASTLLIGLISFVFLARRRSRHILLSALLLLLLFMLTACPDAPLPPPLGTNVIVEGLEEMLAPQESIEIIISVTGMPGGGIASIQVGPDGFRYDPKIIRVKDIRGLNGFEVLASEFNNTTGRGRFAAVNPTRGIVNGPILALLIEAVGDEGTSALQLVKAAMVLGDANNASITGFNTLNGQVSIEGLP